MLKVDLNKENSIVLIEPQGKLSENDFQLLTDIVDPYIKKYDRLKGIVIHTQDFPGWESFTSMVEHIRFIKDHHKKITHIAVVTDSLLGDFAEKLLNHFISAEVKHFTYDELVRSKDWIINDNG